jgi:hypothetical protein
MVCIGVATHKQIEIFIITILYEFLQLPRRKRILGIVWKIDGTNHQPSLHPILVI